jgi:flagellar hook-associated protein 2
MAGISFPGLSGSLPVGDIVDATVNAQKVPFQARIARQQGAYTTDISAMGALKGALDAVNTSFGELGDIDKYQQRTVTGRDDFLSLDSDKDAEIGNYSVKVETLATAHKLRSSAIDAEETLGQGTLSIGSGGNDFDITVAATDTLGDIRDSINDSKSNTSVVATIITDDEGQHLVLSSKETGIENAITVKVDDVSDSDDFDNLGLSRLAYNETNELSSIGIATEDAVGAGTLTLSSDTNSFDITVTVTDTLADIRDKINDSNDNNSMSASIVNDGSGDHLVFNSNRTGAANAITITAADVSDGNNTDASGLSRLVNSNLTALANVANLGESDKAQDAKIIIDGDITVTSSTNTFDNVIDGIDITVKKEHDVDDDDSRVRVAENNDNVAAGINSFLTSFEALSDLAKQLGKAGEDGAGPLAGDSLLRNVVNKLQSQFFQEYGTGDGNKLSLSSLGVKMDLSGKYTLDKDKLNDLLDADPDAVQAFFIGVEADSSANPPVTASNGLATEMNKFLEFYTAENSGIIDKRIESKNNQISKLDDELKSFGLKMDSLEARLFAQYGAADLLVAQMGATSSFLMAQLENMPGVVRKT